MNSINAVAYYRTSSAANVGTDKDTLDRQREAVTSFSATNGLTIIAEYYDAAVSGADHIQQRPGFSTLLDELGKHAAEIILVENASRFARDLAVQLSGHEYLKEAGISLIPVDAPDHFQQDTPTAEMVRQILGSVSQFEKATLVSKLRAARDRKRKEQGKCEGRKSYLETNPALVKEAKRLRRKNPVTGKRRSLRKISDELLAAGYTTSNGTAFSAGQIRRLTNGY
jgi:DNA invertase Pin-like site-specific DNA recombinase